MIGSWRSSDDLFLAAVEVCRREAPTLLPFASSLLSFCGGDAIVDLDAIVEEFLDAEPRHKRHGPDTPLGERGLDYKAEDLFALLLAIGSKLQECGLGFAPDKDFACIHLAGSLRELKLAIARKLNR